MTQKISSHLDLYIESASQVGLSGKASSVYVTLLEASTPLSPKAIITATSLHRQYVYDAIHELESRRLITVVGDGRLIKYKAVSPDVFLKEVEKKRLDALESVATLMNLYNKSPAGSVEIISGSQAVIASEFRFLKEAKHGDSLDVVGGAGMNFVKLFEGRLEEYEKLRKEKNITLRYIGSGEDVVHNRASILKNESRTIPGIGDIVNIGIRPSSVTFNIYEPEVMSVHIKNEAAALSQKALFEVLWKVAS